jgi:hypothetical protein
MMVFGSNGCLRASETEDEEGLSGFRVVGRPATAGVTSSTPLQRHEPRTILERLPHETTFPGGRAIRFPVCTMYNLQLTCLTVDAGSQSAVYWQQLSHPCRVTI